MLVASPLQLSVAANAAAAAAERFLRSSGLTC